MKESKLFYVNRIGWSALTFGLLALDSINTVQSHILGLPPLNLGPATSHIGSLPGAMAASFGAMVGGISTFYLSEKWSRRARIAAPAFLWFLVIGAEQTGFLNETDVTDYPAEMITFLGTACLLELFVSEARRYLTKPSQPNLQLSTIDTT